MIFPLCVIMLACSAPSGPVNTVLLGVSRSAHELVAIDPATAAVTARFPTGKGPHEIALSPDGKTAFVPNLGTYPEPHSEPKEGSPVWVREPSGTVTRIDLAGAKSTTWQLDDCRLPHGVDTSPDGQVVWVTCEDTSSVQELDARTGKRLRNWVTGENGVHELMLIPGRRLLAVANTSGASVTLIHLDDGLLKTLPSGRATEGMAVSGDGSRLYVLSAAEAKLTVVDLDRLAITSSQSIGTKFPISAAIPAGSGELWILGNQSNEILILGESSLSPVTRVELGSQPLGMAASADGAHVFVTLPRRNEIIAVETRTRTIVGRFTGVMEGDGIALREGS